MHPYSMFERTISYLGGAAEKMSVSSANKMYFKLGDAFSKLLIKITKKVEGLLLLCVRIVVPNWTFSQLYPGFRWLLNTRSILSPRHLSADLFLVLKVFHSYDRGLRKLVVRLKWDLCFGLVSALPHSAKHISCLDGVSRRICWQSSLARFLGQSGSADSSPRLAFPVKLVQMLQ